MGNTGKHVWMTSQLQKDLFIHSAKTPAVRKQHLLVSMSLQDLPYFHVFMSTTFEFSGCWLYITEFVASTSSGVLVFIFFLIFSFVFPSQPKSLMYFPRSSLPMQCCQAPQHQTTMCSLQAFSSMLTTCTTYIKINHCYHCRNIFPTYSKYRCSFIVHATTQLTTPHFSLFHYFIISSDLFPMPLVCNGFQTAYQHFSN